jgi:Mrp family chromosome partitioning ATPase
MERLRAALDKAREARASNSGAPAADGAGAPGPASVAEAWAAIAALELDTDRLARRRLISFGRQAEATAFDVLRTKVLQIAGANGWRRIAVTSPLPGSGKTTTSLNLAVALARNIDLRVILMDLDMRRPAIARTLGASVESDVADVLKGSETFGRQARRYRENLAVSMNRGGQRDASDLFLRARTSAVLDGIEATYRPDLMLFDMPPVLVNDDASAFLRNVDCALIVAEAGTTTIAQVDLCEKEIAEQTNVLGVVLNKCRHKGDGYAHYQSYDVQD